MSRVSERIKEAERMGFQRILMPKSCVSKMNAEPDFELLGITSLKAAIITAFIRS